MTSDQRLHGEGREPATVRVAMWSARHRWPVALLWFVATIGMFAVSLAMGGIDAGDVNADPNDRQLEASEAYDVFNAGGTNDPYEQFLVVIAGGPGAATDPAFKTAVGGLVGRAARREGRRSTASRRPPSTRSRARSRRRPRPGWSAPTGRPSGSSPGSPGDDTRVEALLEPRSARSSTPPGRPTRTSGSMSISSTFINEDINELISTGLDDSLRLTIPLTFIILLFAFGAIVASVVPLVLAITSLLAAFGILGIYSQVVGAGQPERDPADRADRARGRGRLLAVHDHPLPGRAAGRPRPGEGDRGLEQHRRSSRLLLRAGGDDLAGRPDHPRRVAVHVDGDRDDLGRARVGRSAA